MNFENIIEMLISFAAGGGLIAVFTLKPTKRKAEHEADLTKEEVKRKAQERHQDNAEWYKEQLTALQNAYTSLSKDAIERDRQILELNRKMTNMEMIIDRMKPWQCYRGACKDRVCNRIPTIEEEIQSHEEA